MDKSDVELIKEKLEECLKLTTDDDGFIHLTLRMAIIHTKDYLEESGDTNVYN
jgi:hypothetical protein